MNKTKVKYAHPRPVALQERDEGLTETPFAAGKDDSLDSNLRHRLISERAYARYCNRGYADGYDLDDWLEAQAEVDHFLLTRGELA